MTRRKASPQDEGQTKYQWTMWSCIRFIFRYISYILTGMVSVLYLVAAFSPYIPPVKSPIPALMGLFFPAFLFVQICALCYWLLLRQFRVVIILLGIFAISWGAVSAYFPINRAEVISREAESQEDRLSVLTYNTCAFGFRRHTDIEPNPILQYIRSRSADIVCLQESMLSPSEGYGVTLRQLKEVLGDLYPHIDVRQAQRGGSTLILLSRYPITSARRVEIKSWSNGAVFYTVDVKGKEFRLVNLHLESFRLRRYDGEQYVDLAKRGEAIQLKDALTNKLGPTFRAHNRQANLIEREIAPHLPEGRIIVCGDFNDTPISYAHRKISNGLKDAYQERGNGFGFTFSTGIFVVRIDHILYGSALEALSAEVDKSITTSDHYPVMAVFRMK